MRIDDTEILAEFRCQPSLVDDLPLARLFYSAHEFLRCWTDPDFIQENVKYMQ